jgi:1-acyl-sn-glycerol-3-phosphate acyltransferase
MLTEGKRAIEQGRPVAIFPEGTARAPRPAPGASPGFAGLYRALGLPVVPVAHNSAASYGAGASRKQPGVIQVPRR